MTTTTAISTHEKCVRTFYDRVDRGDVPGLAALFAEGCVYHRPGYAPYVGRAGVEKFYGAERTIRDGAHNIESVIVTGREAAVQGSFAGTLHDGSPVALRFADFFHFDDKGRVTRRETYFNAPLA